MKKFNIAILLIICATITGCNGKRVLLSRTIERFMNTEIQLPELSSAMFNGKDTLMVLGEGIDAQASDLPKQSSQLAAKMVVLFDSTVCGSCKMSQIWQWEVIPQYAKTLHGGLEPIFIFAPAMDKVHELKVALKTHPVEWPIFIDAEQKFLQANPHIPKNKALHTFLLDKNNHVVLVGDPIGNDKLWGLYMKTIRQLIDNGGVLLNDK